jgi:hypothetical protein
MVIFTFESQNHTVTQSAFTTPCEALAGGKDSGFMANINNTVSPAPQMAIQVTVATPVCESTYPNSMIPSNTRQGSIANKKVIAERE